MNEYDKIFKDMDKLFKSVNTDMNKVMKDMDAHVQEILKEARNMKQAFTWSEWEAHKLSWPKRINQRWYWIGDTVYRRERLRGLTGSGQFEYGDEFDILKEKHND